jgi:hypothetical protein
VEQKATQQAERSGFASIREHPFAALRETRHDPDQTADVASSDDRTVSGLSGDLDIASAQGMNPTFVL